MASAELRDELDCSICLSLYTDPVSLRCGHNFCRSCIVQVLDTQDGSGGYSCPDCRAEYPERPALEKNRKLGNIVERFLSTYPDMEETRIFCTYCTKSPVPAVKSCLHCENSLCGDHLTAHNKTMNHILTEPTNYFGNKKCSIHKKVLEYYCPQDAACLCGFCLVGEHRGHIVELIDNAFEEKVKKLRKDLEEIKCQKAEFQTRLQNLYDHQRNIQEKASDKRKNVSKLFMDINKQLEMAEKKALSEISRQEEKIVSQISDLIKKLEIEEDELSRKMRHLEEMCHVTDPIRLLQEPDITVCDHGGGEDTGRDGGKIKSENESDPEIQDNEAAPVTDQESEQGKTCDNNMVEDKEEAEEYDMVDDLDEVVILLILHRSMRDIVINVTSQLGFHVPDILLDEDTAHGYVKVSEDLKTATRTAQLQKRPKSPGRFLSYPQLLSRCGFSSGRHYWEVEWNQFGRCDVGMSYPSVEKRGEQSGIGDNDKSWCIIMRDSGFIASHNSVISILNVKPICPTLGVFLDYESGRLSFYELCDPIRHLHTFTASFSEPLHVIFFIDHEASVTMYVIT
ncbi:E3 ubiquitin/ISG15 ligase TRIM25-like [Dendropsophus ebraccatus]|uniref:E3 ubiquitin/ISG15 ligase TRIM25-like n=1 Tax=Dendropsophus ebraccatus TaxID=150705 RepID=UPI0038319237